MGKLLSLLGGVGSFFVPGGPFLGILGYIFKPSRVIIWLPLLFLVVSILFAGVQAKNYVHRAEANGVLVVQQGDKIKSLSDEVELQRQSVLTATRNIQTYTTAVQTYARQQYQYQQQITTIRSKLEPTKITEKAQTDAKGASDDLNGDYADMLRLFDDATGAAAVASGGGQGNPVKTVTTTTVTREDTARPMASSQKGDTGP